MKRSIKILIYGLCSAVTSLIYILLVPYATQYLGSGVLLGVCVIALYFLGCFLLPRFIFRMLKGPKVIPAWDYLWIGTSESQKGVYVSLLIMILGGVMAVSLIFNDSLPKELETQTAAAVEESYDKGYQAGIEETQAACDEAYEKGYSAGQEEGEKNGYTEGYLEGWNLGLDDGLTSSPTEHRLPSRDPIR